MYDYSYMMNDELSGAVGIAYIVYYLFTFLIGVAGYILSSVGLHTIAKRRGIGSPWLAWIPVIRVWIIGSISDQYRYITKGQIKNKRKILLVLNIVTGILSVVLIAVAGFASAELMMMGTGATEAELLSAVAGIVYAVFHYMAMYDLYTSVNPSCSVAFLVLSIVFGVTEPFFIFFNRKKDGGMPPRCDIPVEPVQAQPQYLPAQPSIQDLLEEPAEAVADAEEPTEA